MAKKHRKHRKPSRKHRTAKRKAHRKVKRNPGRALSKRRARSAKCGLCRQVIDAQPQRRGDAPIKHGGKVYHQDCFDARVLDSNPRPARSPSWTCVCGMFNNRRSACWNCQCSRKACGR